jgi:Tfp pilus assembly protein PilN
MSNEQQPIVNLIPQEQVHLRLRSQWIHRWVMGVVLTTLVIGIPGVYIGGSAVLTDSGMVAQIQDVNIEYENQQNAIPQLRQQIKQLSAEQEVLDLIKNRIEWSKVFSILVASAGERIRFSRLTATGGGIEGDEPIELYLEGLAASQTDARAFVVRIESTQVFDSVELMETTREIIEEIEFIRLKVIVKILSIGRTPAEDEDAG